MRVKQPSSVSQAMEKEDHMDKIKITVVKQAKQKSAARLKTMIDTSGTEDKSERPKRLKISRYY